MPAQDPRLYTVTHAPNVTSPSRTVGGNRSTSCATPMQLLGQERTDLEDGAYCNLNMFQPGQVTAVEIVFLQQLNNPKQDPRMG